MRVLLVEDSSRLQAVVAAALRKCGYAVDVSGDGEEGLWLGESTDYDVMILDIMLPKLDGLSVLAQLRRKGRTAPLLLLTSRDAAADRVQGLRAGADDYLVKPFDLDELLARVEALCRRGYGARDSRIVVGRLEVDLLARLVRIAGQPIELTAKEYAMIEYLAHRRGVVVSRTEIEEHIYDASGEMASNVVDTTICILRKKIAAATSAAYIHTRRGMGYVLHASAELAETT